MLTVPPKQANRLEAYFYRTGTGNEPVRIWLKTLTKEDRKSIGDDVAYMQYKWPIGKPQVDHLRGPVWEVRTSLGNRIARTLFAVDNGCLILLHGFIKKTQKTAASDIDLAEKRFKEWRDD